MSISNIGGTNLLVWILLLTAAIASTSETAWSQTRNIRVAIIQFDAIPEEVDRNLNAMERLARQAVAGRARWVVFHEGTVCDYTNNLEQLAETVPEGKSTIRMERLARELDCYISFGLSEKDKDRRYITQVFVGKDGYFYHYRKTWLHKSPEDLGFRNELARYDPGTGPELFSIDGVQATCFICADAMAPRCIQRAKLLHPQVVFYPVNIATKDPTWVRKIISDCAKQINAPFVTANRVGPSWVHREANGGSAIYSSQGTLLAGANSEGREEIVFHDLEIAPRSP
ncbi:MAG: carbon-nitrogen hydrolase family protein [Pirellulales bacterium]|nr:carbon-nitrogen hydrolase family protein [Pirellulales bacterium]